MLGKSPDQNQMNLFRGTLKEFINPEHPLVILADRIPWGELEKEFSKEELDLLKVYMDPVAWAEKYLRDPMNPNRPFKLRWYQKKILNSRKRKKVIRAGRRIGKSVTLITEIDGDVTIDGDDITNNRFAKIDSYIVVDGKLTYTWKELNVFFGVNNIFDEFYETLAFSESYFTMPTRNYFGGVDWRF